MVCWRRRADMEVVSSPCAAELAAIRPRVSHPDRQQEDCFLLQAFARAGAEAILFCVTELLRPSSCPWSGGRWVGGAPQLYLSTAVTLHMAPLTFTSSSAPPACPGRTLASWFKGLEKTEVIFSNFPECNARSNLASLRNSVLSHLRS